MTEVGFEKEGSLLKDIREWVPYIGAKNGDVLEVLHGPLGRPKKSVGPCEIRIRSSKEAQVITGLLVGETMLTPLVRIQSMRIVSPEESEGDI